MHGKPALEEGFSHFPYTQPNIGHAGTLRLAEIGGFDNFNPFITRGNAAKGLVDFVFERLTARNYDEPFSLYGLLAEKLEIPEDRSSVTFWMNPKARFSDGTRLGVKDVIFTFNLLRKEGRPNHRFYYNKVSHYERIGKHAIRFFFKEKNDRELPLIIGLMVVLPKHYYENIRFDEVNLRPPLGSGPYIVSSFDVPSRMVLKQNPEYWGKNLNVNKGRFAFKEIIREYYRDKNTSFEAFKAGKSDIWVGSDPTRWSEQFGFQAVKERKVLKKKIVTSLPSGLNALVFNTRRDIFKDVRVRKALELLFDFEWINKNLYNNSFIRTQSYFDNSPLSSHNVAANSTERKWLKPYKLEKEILKNGYTAPKTRGDGYNRKARREALQLLSKAGYKIKKGALINKKTQQPFSFELLVVNKQDERLALSYASMLKRAGIEPHIRYVDSSQYQQRLTDFDFDMIFYRYYASLSPGNEQLFYWSSDAANTKGSRNYAGIKHKGIDRMIEYLLAAKNRDEFTDATRALDRLLMSGTYFIPLYYQKHQWLAYWNHIAMPAHHSLYGIRPDSWWRKEKH
ncbi:MAG: extracellular solute-binding protein [Parvibaculales bacterium]